MTLHHLVVLALWAAILLTVVEGVRRRDASATVNALVALCAALLPAAVDAFVAPVAVPPAVSLWVALAGLLHSVGMLGPYDTVWWWDHLTHSVSAALVAALAYAAALARPGSLPGGPAGATLLFVAGAGVAWELLELVARDVAERLDIDPVLVFYGWRDTALDLGFDLLGALAVVLLDLRLFLPVVEPFPAATRAVAGTVVVVIVGASVAMTGYLLAVGRTGDS